MGAKKVPQYAMLEHGTQDEKIASACRTLKLDAVAASFKNIANRMNQEHATLYDFLESLLEKEMMYKEENRITRWIQQAHFTYKATIEEFDFSFQPTIDERLIRELASCRFVEEGRNVIFLGDPGVGKTHLSIALGFEAIHLRYETKFLKLDEFVDRVKKEMSIDSSSKFFKAFARPRLLILDDMDFYDTGENASTVLFKLICYRHEKNLSTIFTSNKEFHDWEKLFGSKQRAAAALDRIIGNAVVINIKNGISYRTPKPTNRAMPFKKSVISPLVRAN